jgi:hypothetical protein
MVVHLDYTIENINGAVCGVVQRDQEPVVTAHCGAISVRITVLKMPTLKERRTSPFRATRRGTPAAAKYDRFRCNLK